MIDTKDYPVNVGVSQGFIFGSTLAVSFEPLAQCRNVASLSLFYRYHFGRCTSELADLVPRPYFRRTSTCYSDRLHDFSVAISGCYNHSYVNSFFHRTARLWNFLEYFPLTNGLKDLSLKLTDTF